MAEPLRKDTDWKESTGPRYPEPSPTASVEIDEVTLRNEYSPNRLAGFAPEPRPSGWEVEHQTGLEEERGAGVSDKAKQLADEARDRLSAMGEQAREAADTAKERISEWSDKASRRASELRERWNERFPAWKRTAKNTLYNTRVRVNRSTREYPLQSILVAGVVGFAVGVALRIWRSNSRG